MAQTTARVDDVNLKKLPDGRELFIVLAGGRDFSTMKRELAVSAQGLKGRMATLTFTEKQKGQYENRYLDEIEAGPEQAEIFPTATVTEIPVHADAKTIEIRRAVGLKAAVEVVKLLPANQQNSAAIIQVSEFFVEYLANGPKGSVEQLNQIPTEATPF